MSFAATRESLASVPLGALPVVVIDTETTGLDASRDRVLEIGAVRLTGRRVDGAETFSTLVKPDTAIPASASAIHGIEEADVAGAPEFTAAMAELADWTGPAIIVGYSIGFDLAILKAEHARNAMFWRQPRSLDVRHLLDLLAPNLPDQSLDTVAGWLEIEVKDRHRAIADALLAARVFVALIPRLRDRGITTLAQAERACRSLTKRLEEEAHAGWGANDQFEERTAAGVAEFARIDSFPYRHRVADLMHSPPRITASDTCLKDALEEMTREGVSSLFLAPLDDGGPFGIITERDLMRAVAAVGAEALDQEVARFGQRPLVTVESDEFVYRAMALMAAKGFRHLGVTGPDGQIVGALSARNLLRQRADDAVSLGERLEAATVGDLGRVWSELTMVVRALVGEQVDVRNIAAIISRELCALTRRACELAEIDMVQSGEGQAPVPYALLVLGSAGRGESLLAMDQDNAIVFLEGEPGGTADRWFEELGKRFTAILDEAGVPYCKGGVMASNPAWRMDAAGWRKAVRSWVSRSSPEDILNCDIFFDALPVHGEIPLGESLTSEAWKIAGGERSFLKFLALNASDFSVPIGLFGRFRSTGGRVDLKAGGIMPIFSAARVAALRHGLRARSTPERLDAMRPLDVVSGATIDNLIEAHRILLGQILSQQLRDIEDGVPLANKVAPGKLTSPEKQRLKWALNQIPSTSDILGTPVLG